MFKLYPWRQGLVSKFPKSDEELESDAVTFCERYASDPPYCYPEVVAKEREFTAPPEQTDCVCVTPVVTGLGEPLAVVDPADKSGRLFILVAEPGIVKIFNRRTNHILEDPFLNITSLLMRVTGIQSGVTNMVLHPDFKKNGRLYVFHIQALNATDDMGLFSVNISEFQVDKDNPNHADYESQRLIFSYLFEKHVPGFHLHGGGLFFKDGYLYIAIGRPEYLEDVLFNLGSYDGKLLRIDVDGRDPGREYAIPRDNPFIDDPSALPEIYAYGFAQPWRCSVDTGDPQTGTRAGRIFCGDIGTADLVEEVNIIHKGGNYGYPAFEGDNCLVDNQTCNEVGEDVVPPTDTYPYGPQGDAVIGGYVYRGCLYPNMKGLYIYADFIGGLLVLKENRTSGEWEHRRLCVGDSEVCPGADSQPMFVSTLGQDDGGEVYIASVRGTIYQITDPSRRSDPQRCKRRRI